ncbi:hypothetical protein GCM10010277_84510 [Streptomyces longisporoflavus]|nr:hypothetical protein GCM10010277_84510 [Streptomyces longisporoflavus]
MARRDVEAVSGRVAQQPDGVASLGLGRGEDAAQACDVRVHDAADAVGRMAGPDAVDECVDGNGLLGLYEESRKKTTLACRAQIDLLAIYTQFNRPEHLECDIHP